LWDSEDGVRSYCFGGCGPGDKLATLIEYGLFDDDDECVHDEHIRHYHRRDADDRWRIERACRLYDSYAPAAGTIVERYLREARGIPGAVPPVLRFGLYHRFGCDYPAMAAPVVDVNGVQTGTHFTFLRPDGSGKADVRKDDQRRTRGVIGGGAIRLHDVERDLVIAEGIETALSATVIFNMPAWSAVFAGGLKTVELPPAIRRVVVAADHDINGTGQRNAVAAHDRWTAEGRTVRIVTPPNAGDDFNEVLKRRKT
jgi:hypothetical protein